MWGFLVVLFLWLCFLPNLQPLMSTSLRMPPQTRLSSWPLQRCLPTSTCWTRPLNMASPKAGKRMQTKGGFAKHQKMESFFVCIPSNLTINHIESTILLFGKAMVSCGVQVSQDIIPLCKLLAGNLGTSFLCSFLFQTF